MKNLLNSAFRCMVLNLAMISMFSVSGWADEASWRAETIADASTAAPPSVTDDATILGWTPDGKLVTAREGSGPYTCIASGSFSVRIGKPSLPYPDPMCLDQNAWAFLQAIWAGKAAGESKNKLPRAPGLVWMLVGMNVTKSAVDVGASTITVTEDTAKAGAKEVVQMTPHVMIMPLPFDETSAALTTRYSLDKPLDPWIMAAGKPHEHLMVHFSTEDARAMMKPGE
ncbi:MAG: hypothetical protein H6905_06095 [Hyphomicrobiales bacterium]|nr:hypothetical protein [Hyphomicrobiales bacterium]